MTYEGVVASWPGGGQVTEYTFTSTDGATVKVLAATREEALKAARSSAKVMGLNLVEPTDTPQEMTPATPPAVPVDEAIDHYLAALGLTRFDVEELGRKLLHEYPE